MTFIILCTIGILYILNKQSLGKFIKNKVKHILHSTSYYENFNTETTKNDKNVNCYNSNSEYQSNSHYESN